MSIIERAALVDRYWPEIERVLAGVFDREIDAQPVGVAELGAVDGRLLRRVFETVRDRTRRGAHLAERPLTAFALGSSEAAVHDVRETLAGISHDVLITPGSAREMLDGLRQRGIDPGRVLWIRLFQDSSSGPRDWFDAVSGHGVVAAWDDAAGETEGADDLFLTAAVGAGLFPQRDTVRTAWPADPGARMAVALFEPRPYRARRAAPVDLPGLQRLETAWTENLRLPAEALRRRLDVHPHGQWVIDVDGEVAAGVYSQRIASVERLSRVRFAELPELHEPEGPVVQLLGVSVLPERQHLGLGDQLVDLMLVRAALDPRIRQVAAITRCKEFRGRSLDELREYVARRDAAGRPVDPILRFHHGRGARLIGLVPDCRPEDTDNVGAGVLVRYDFVPGTAVTAAAVAAVTGPALPADPRGSVEEAVSRLLGEARRGAFAWNRALRDMGLDSLDLLDLRRALETGFGRSFEPTFFFSHPTPREIVLALSGESDPSASADAARVVRLDSVACRDDAPGPTAASADVSPAVSAGEKAVPGPHDRALAVIGIAGRFAGCDDLEQYWNLLAAGRDAVTEVPRSRWDIDAYFSADPDAPGKIVTRFGGFVDRPDEFDAAFFAISPREAELMDPQQRLLLEAHWDALEDAGIDPGRLREAACGIFVGLYTHDYELLQAESGDEDVSAYHATGTSPSVAAGRIAYLLGTRGPAMTLDTACSSSLVAVHQAARSLRSGECDVAIASGVNLLLSPRLSIAFSRAGMLSPDGRCKTFDAAANGYVRSEGCGAVVLKRVADALRDGDRILAVIRGSAVNQDGASNGLTAPSLSAQEQLLRRALDDARVAPSGVDYVEAHGTGTSLGDPVEFQALRNVFGADPARREPLWLGSVKTNIGHAEAAAGIAGLIKVVLAMQRGRLPAHLHFTRSNPLIDLASLPARIPVETRAWDGHGRPLRCGVSSFGFSGTNAHVIVEQHVDVRGGVSGVDRTHQPVGADLLSGSSTAPSSGAADRPRHLLPLSAKSAPALGALIDRYVSWLDARVDACPGDVCHTAAVGRAHHPFRVAVSGADGAELCDSLRSTRGRDFTTAFPDRPPRIGFLFTGQGSQYPGMARELARSEPVFRRALAECSGILSGALARPLEQILYPTSEPSALIHETGNTQPALFAIEYALARMIGSWGIEPAAVMGHSVGEYVAACLAGVFSLEDGLRLIATRGRLMQALPRGGAMLAVLGPADATLAAVSTRHDVSVAACNGPANVVISGPRAAVEALGRRLEREGARAVPLMVSHAFHSALMDPILPAFRDAARAVRFGRPRLDLVSNVSGALAGEDVITAEYWTRHLREPVRFDACVRTLASRGIDVMLEIGPHPVLSSMGPPCLDGCGADRIAWLHTLSRGASDWQTVLDALGALYELGASPDWRAFDSAYARRRVALPTYPWQRKRHWLRQIAPAPRVVTSVRMDETVTSRPTAGEVLFAPRWVPSAHLDDPVPARSASFFPDGAAIGVAAAAARDATRARYPAGEVHRLLDASCRDAVLAALREIGWSAEAGAVVSAARLIAHHRVAPRYARLLERLLEILFEDGCLERSGGEYRVLAPLPAAAPSFEEVLSGARSCAATLTLLRRCAASLGRVLRGTVDPLALLFPDGDMSDADSLYTQSPFAVVGNEMAAAAVARGIELLPPGRVLRILEVGAGTGGLTTGLLGVLPPDRTEYVFTDVSPAFLSRARVTFRQFPFVRYEVFSAERDPASQGFAPHQFDVVVAANALHATVDLRAAVRHAGQLLAPGGLLLLVEGLLKTRWIDLVFGPADGWWRFEDTATRPDHPLLDAARWCAVLDSAGLVSPQVVAAADGDGAASLADIFPQGLVMARVPSRGLDAAPAPRQVRARRRWIVVGDSAGHGEAFARRAAADGDAYEIVRAGGDVASGIRGVLARLPQADVVDLSAVDAGTPRDSAAAVLDAAAACGLAVAEVIRTAAAGGARSVRIVTRGASAVRTGELPAPAAATIVALGNVAMAEYPALEVQTIDLDPDVSIGQEDALLREVRGAAAGARVAFRQGQRYVRVLAPARAGGEAPPCDPDSTYLIVGGTGDLGLHTARWLVARGARRLVLTGRTVFPARAEWVAREADAVLAPKIGLLRAMEAAGASIRFEMLDVQDRVQVDALLESIPPSGRGRLRGVVQAAAVIDDQLISDVSASNYAHVLAPKVAGTWNLYDALRTRPLDFFLLYSSIGSIVGLPGQASYAAANAFMDALAWVGRAGGVPMLSVNWCGWRETSLARSSGGRRGIAELELLGIASIRPDDATSLLGAALASGEAQIATVPLVARRDATGLRGLDPLIARLVATAGGQGTGRPDGAALPQSGVATVSAALPGEDVQQLVIRVVAELLDLDPAAVDPDASLGDLGMDSLLALEFRRIVQRQCQVVLSPTLVWSYPTARAVAGHIASRVGTPEAVPSSPAPRPAEPVLEASSGLLADVEGLSDEEALQRIIRRA